jgi:subtilisin family serine protease
VLLAAPSFGATVDSLLVSPSSARAGAQLRAFLKRPGIRSKAPLFSASERKALLKFGGRELADTWLVRPRDVVTETLLRDWARAHAPGLAVEIDSPARPADVGPSPSAAPTPAPASAQDPLEPEQWGLHNSGATQKQAIDDLTNVDVPGAPGEDIGVDRAPPESLDPAHRVIVAIVDTGVDSTHPDLAGRVLRKQSECDALTKYQTCLKTGTAASCAPLGSVDTDGNGYPMDCIGWDVTAGPNASTGVFGGQDTSDPEGHGTHVAGIVAAALNGIGVRGVAQNVAILPVKVITSTSTNPVVPQDANGPQDVNATSPQASPSPLPLAPSPIEGGLNWGTGFTDIVARGMLYAIRNGAQVINLSLAWPAGADSITMQRMSALAQARGALVVAAAGNDSADSRVLPCQYPGVICVASHGPGGILSNFSNYGAFVDVAAPGLSILSTYPLALQPVNFTSLTGYELKDGTSMASPFVAGMLARLLGAGYSPEEAYARLLVGARPTPVGAAATVPGSPGGEKFTRSGNADLARAFAADSQTLILPSSKSVVRLGWDGVAASLPFSFALHDYWASGSSVQVTASLGGTPGAHLSRTQWTFDSWNAGEDKTLSTQLVIDSPSVDGRLLLELTVQEGSRPARVTYVPLEVAIAVTPNLADPRVETLPIAGQLPGSGSIRSVTAFDGVATQDYLILSSSSAGFQLTLLTQQAARYDVAATAQMPQNSAMAQGNLLLVQRLDVDRDGKSDYVLVWQLPPATIVSTMPRIQFQFLDSSLQPLKAVSADGTLTYDNSTSPLPERFQWMRVPRRDGTGEILAPAWITAGTTPPLEKPKFDPWNPNPSDPPRNRLYYLATDGVRSVAPSTGASDPQTDTKTFFIQLLAQSPAAQARGDVVVLQGSGTDYVLKYAYVPISEAKAQAASPVTLPQYRMLLGLQNVLDAVLLDDPAATPGTAFAGGSTRGAQRTTLLAPVGATPAALATSGATHDSIQAPTAVTDGITSASGVFTGARHSTVVSQLHYDLQFADLDTGDTALATMDHFSFLPSFISSRIYFPVVARNAGERVPAILVPASLGVSNAAEVIVPSYAGDHLTGLSRPARLRIATGQGCPLSLGNPVPATATAPSKLAFFCMDRIVRIPLE